MAFIVSIAWGVVSALVGFQEITRGAYSAHIVFIKRLGIIRAGTPLGQPFHSRRCRNRSAFATTLMELRLIATPANMGFMSKPKTGYSTPAASGTPMPL